MCTYRSQTDAEGLRLIQNKVEAIGNAASFTNVTELGLLNYFEKFLPNISTVLTPIHLLPRKDVKSRWIIERLR